MKHFLFIIFLWGIYSCTDTKSTNKETPSVLKEFLTPPSDSFNVRRLEMEPSLQYDIPLDTIYIPQNKKHLDVVIIFPKLHEPDFPEVKKRIDNVIKKRKDEFFETIADEKVEYDTSLKLDQGYDMRIFPKSLYQTEKVISFATETVSGYSGGTSAFEYDVINYDLEDKKIITLKDYFILNSQADTSYLEKIIGRAVDNEVNIRRYAEMGGYINFSFDDTYVYFYFDRYDMICWGIRSVKKKYILDHINPEFR